MSEELRQGLELISSCYMCGLIWFVQLVHYPLIAAVPDGERIAYCRQHQHRTSFVVVIPMVVECGTAFLFWWNTPTFSSSVGLGLVMAIWMSTAVFQVPLHKQLAMTGEKQLVEALVRTNWVRTVLWTVRAVTVTALYLKISWTF